MPQIKLSALIAEPLHFVDDLLLLFVVHNFKGKVYRQMALFGASVEPDRVYSSTVISQSIPFDVWKQRLQDDCRKCGKLLAFEALGEDALRLLWESGTQPSVQGVIVGGMDEAKLP